MVQALLLFLRTMPPLVSDNSLYICRLKELYVPEDSILWEVWCTGQHGNQASLSVRIQDSSSIVASVEE